MNLSLLQGISLLLELLLSDEKLLFLVPYIKASIIFVVVFLIV